MARIASAQPRRLPQPSHAHTKCTLERPPSLHRYPISCPVSRLSSPQTAFNPHTLTALAAYCKSPYPHCSAPAASEREKFSPPSTSDTALEISHQLTPRLVQNLRNLSFSKPRISGVRRSLVQQRINRV